MKNTQNSPTREKVLEIIKKEKKATVKELTKELGITPMAIRGHLNKYLKAVERGETLVLTSRNREVAKITAPDDKRIAAKQALGELRKTATVGDVLSSSGETWKAIK